MAEPLAAIANRVLADTTATYILEVERRDDPFVVDQVKVFVLSLFYFRSFLQLCLLPCSIQNGFSTLKPGSPVAKAVNCMIFLLGHPVEQNKHGSVSFFNGISKRN